MFRQGVQWGAQHGPQILSAAVERAAQTFRDR
jgi:hypothetical protein